MHSSSQQEAISPLKRVYPKAIRRAMLVGLFAGYCLATAGCSGPRRAKDVEVEVARKTLIQVLDHWKNGGAIGDFREQTPEIIIQEAEWSNGCKLMSYVLDDEPEALDGNWFCEVELTLATPNGGKSYKKTVTFAVGTDPVLTVFHAML